MEKLLLDVGCKNPLVADEPAPQVRLRAFGDSGLEFDLLFWIHESKDRDKVIHEVNRAILTEFNRAGIVFAVPQREIYMHQTAEESNPDERSIRSSTHDQNGCGDASPD